MFVKRFYYKLVLFKYLTRRTISVVLLIVILLNIFIINHSRNKLEDTHVASKVDKRIADIGQAYSPDLTLDRLNSLFSVLEQKESQLKYVFIKLNVILFSDVRDLVRNQSLLINTKYNEYDEEFKTYLTVNKQTNHVEATEKFMQYLNALSNRYTFQTQFRKSIKFRSYKSVKLNNSFLCLMLTLNRIYPLKDEEKPVFMTAANHKYYTPLLETIENLKQIFPDFKLIIYDLGLKEKNLNVVSLIFCTFSFKI